jgi:TonB family protein
MLTFPHYSKVLIVTALLACGSHALEAQTDVTLSPQQRRIMLRMPRPTYPEEARAQGIIGSGVCEIIIDPPTGVVTRVTVVRSTRSKVLDAAAVRAFRGWRAQPGKVSRMRVPFTFTFGR